MMTKYKTSLLVTVVIFFAFPALSAGRFNFVSAREIVITNSSLPSVVTPTISLLDEIAQARQLLQKSKPLKFEEQRIRKTSKKELVRKQIALAILDQDSGQIFERRVWIKESDIKNYQKIGYIVLVPDLKNEPLDIQVQWWNSFNTPYIITGNPNMVVLANKYLLPTTSVPYPNERSRTQYSEIIYTPYSDVFHQSEIIKAGKDHIDKMVDAAFQSLQLRNVKSQSVPGKLVTDVVNKDFVKNIIVVEHVDPSAFAIAGDGGRLLTDRVLAIIGANQDKAYSYTGSPAGASGIAQFIKSTYSSTRNNYPTAGLIPDFGLGMANHENAFKAMVLFFDSHKKAIEDKIMRKDVLAQFGGGVTEEMLALAYNGGSTKVIRSVNNYGLAWISGQLDSSVPRIFRPETIGYFNKFEAIKNLNIF